MVPAKVNLIRMDPLLFRKTFIQFFIDKKNYDATEEYFASLIKDINTASPCKELIFPHSKLYEAASFHAEDMGRTGMTGHSSSDGTDTFVRLNRFVTSRGGMAENCQYGPDKPIDVLMNLMIDQGIPSLGHRKTILNCTYNFIGISQRKHLSYSNNTVMDFME